MIHLKYLVTGTGRSGTVFAARFLTSLGIGCSHETIFDWRGYKWAEKRLAGEEPLKLSLVSTAKKEDDNWKDIEKWIDLENIQAESSYMAAPFLDGEILQDTKVIHIVRNPIKVVNSFCNYIDYFSNKKANNSYEQFIYHHVPELKMNMPQYDRACLFYVRWNQMIEKHKTFFYKVEDDPKQLLEFLSTNSNNCFSDYSINTLKKPCKNKFMSLSQIESKEIKNEFMDIGNRYGYDMPLDIMII